MANYFTNFSLILELGDETQQKYALDLAQQASRIQQGDEEPKDFPTDLTAVVEDWHFETEAGDSSKDLWLCSMHGGIDAVCAFIQHLLKKFELKQVVTFEWSHDCTKPRVDAFGGGAAVITATHIQTFNTAEWVRQQTQNLKA